MGLKDFFSNKKDSSIFDSTTVVVNKKELDDDLIDNNKEQRKPSGSTNIIRPESFLDVEKIAEELLKGKSIIVDLTSTSITEAKRICDFLNGVTYAINGQVKKIAKLVYLFSPSSN